MANCEDCGKALPFLDRNGGKCHDCWQKHYAEEREKSTLSDAERSAATEALKVRSASITFTTETTGDSAATRLGIVSGTCVFGAHLGKDIMAAWRDMTGGRAASAEQMFKDARAVALEDLRLEAARIGADAVIAVRIEHQELAGGGKSMVMVTATGTAIRNTLPN